MLVVLVRDNWTSAEIPSGSSNHHYLSNSTWQSLCHDQEEPETGKHQAVTLRVTPSSLCIRKIIVAIIGKRAVRETRVQSCYLKYGLPSAILVSPRRFLECRISGSTADIPGPTPDLLHQNLHYHKTSGCLRCSQLTSEPMICKANGHYLYFKVQEKSF